MYLTRSTAQTQRKKSHTPGPGNFRSPWGRQDVHEAAQLHLTLTVPLTDCVAESRPFNPSVLLSKKYLLCRVAEKIKGTEFNGLGVERTLEGTTSTWGGLGESGVWGSWCPAWQPAFGCCFGCGDYLSGGRATPWNPICSEEMVWRCIHDPCT